jgi:hypothetical protein
MKKDTSKVSEMACIRIPVGHQEFLEANPRVAQVVGKMLMTIHELSQGIEIMKSMMRDSDKLVHLIEDGTREDLEAFVEAALLSQQEDGILHVKNLPPGAYEKIKERLKGKATETYLT